MPLLESEKQYVQSQVDNKVMPTIKAELGLFGWILKTIFPKLNKKLYDAIILIASTLLANRFNKSGTVDDESEPLCGGLKKPTNPPPGSSPGEYHCVEGSWVWIEIGGRRK